MQCIYMPTKIYKIQYLNFMFSIFNQLMITGLYYQEDCNTVFSFPNYSKEYCNEVPYKILYIILSKAS